MGKGWRRGKQPTGLLTERVRAGTRARPGYQLPQPGKTTVLAQDERHAPRQRRKNDNNGLN